MESKRTPSGMAQTTTVMLFGLRIDYTIITNAVAHLPAFFVLLSMR
jgi:hypothetical protein